MPKGTRLREAEWSTRLGVNRTALREAFARLEAEGFIEKGPKSGYCAPGMASEDVREVSEVRVMLEGGAIERIIHIGQNTPKHLRAMHEACDELERLAEDHFQHSGVAEADRRFHEALIDASANRRLNTIYRRAPLPLIPPKVVDGKEWEERVRNTVEEHRAILAALMDGDAPRARNVLRVHLHERPLIGPHLVPG